MVSQEYDSEILKKLQKTELEILKDFVKICDKYHLPYFATGGTAIGALRHQGFIPWDDDIDVCMLRKDYEKFMEVAPQEMGDRYAFMTTETEPRYPLMFGKDSWRRLISRLIIRWASLSIFFRMTKLQRIQQSGKNFRKRHGTGEEFMY